MKASDTATVAGRIVSSIIVPFTTVAEVSGDFAWRQPSSAILEIGQRGQTDGSTVALGGLWCPSTAEP